MTKSSDIKCQTFLLNCANEDRGNSISVAFERRRLMFKPLDSPNGWWLKLVPNCGSSFLRIYRCPLQRLTTSRSLERPATMQLSKANKRSSLIASAARSGGPPLDLRAMLPLRSFLIKLRASELVSNYINRFCFAPISDLIRSSRCSPNLALALVVNSFERISSAWELEGELEGS